jgi:hypothetical protein
MPMIKRFPLICSIEIEAITPAVRATNETEYQQTCNFSGSPHHLPNKMYFCPFLKAVCNLK